MSRSRKASANTAKTAAVASMLMAACTSVRPMRSTTRRNRDIRCCHESSRDPTPRATNRKARPETAPPSSAAVSPTEPFPNSGAGGVRTSSATTPPTTNPSPPSSRLRSSRCRPCRVLDACMAQVSDTQRSPSSGTPAVIPRRPSSFEAPAVFGGRWRTGRASRIRTGVARHDGRDKLSCSTCAREQAGRPDRLTW